MSHWPTLSRFSSLLISPYLLGSSQDLAEHELQGGACAVLYVPPVALCKHSVCSNVRNCNSAARIVTYSLKYLSTPLPEVILKDGVNLKEELCHHRGLLCRLYPIKETAPLLCCYFTSLVAMGVHFLSEWIWRLRGPPTSLCTVSGGSLHKKKAKA